MVGAALRSVSARANEMATPLPGLDEVRITVAFSGVNPGDVKKRQSGRVWLRNATLSRWPFITTCAFPTPCTASSRSWLRVKAFQ